MTEAIWTDQPGARPAAAPAGSGPVDQAEARRPAGRGSGAAGLAVLLDRHRLDPVLDLGRPPSASALLTSQVLAHGMTSPLREMTAAARAMARGDYTRRVRATSPDEVGELAGAFNQMAADLAEADRQRRELIANVSHELRTPITALQGVLENIVDGVAEPDPATLRTALAQTERLGRLVADLLDLSRLDAGVVPLRPGRHRHRRLPGRGGPARPRSPRPAPDATVTFRVRQPAAPLNIKADPWRLHQVFANLLDNAARHSPPGGTVLVTRSERRPTARRRGDRRGRRHPARRSGTGSSNGSPGASGPATAAPGWAWRSPAGWCEMHGGTIAVAEPAPNAANRRNTGCRIRVSLPLGPVRTAVATGS